MGNDTYTGTLISDLIATATALRKPTPAQWQAAKQQPTQFGDSKNVPVVKVRTFEPSPDAEDDMERDRR
jgi:hypothetical protein